MADENIWCPEKFLTCGQIQNAGNYAIVVLNRPIIAAKELIEGLWSQGEEERKSTKAENSFIVQSFDLF